MKTDKLIEQIKADRGKGREMLIETGKELSDRIKEMNDRILADAEALKAADELERLLRRYFTETPLGHQPHMIDEDTQKALAAYNAKRGERE